MRIQHNGRFLNSWMNRKRLAEIINNKYVVLVHQDNVLDDSDQYYARVQMVDATHVSIEPISKGVYKHWSLSSWIRDENGIVVGYEASNTLHALSIEINYDPQYEYAPEVQIRTCLMAFDSLYDYCLFKVRLEDAIKEYTRRIEMGDF